MDGYFLENLKKLEENRVFFESEAKEDELDKFLIFKDGKTWHMKSDVSMELPIDIWCEQFENVSDTALIAIFGLGDVGYLVELAKKHNSNSILVYEPDEKNILKQLGKAEMKVLLSKDNIIWVGGKNRKREFGRIVDECIDYKYGICIEEGRIPNYYKAYPEEYIFFKEQIALAKVYMVVARNTRIKMESDRGKCFLYNINDVPKQSSVNNLIKVLKKNDVTSYPAVIIAAGPSLDKNIMDLVPYQDKVFIICLDSAIRTAIKWRIRPDLIICVDPVKNPDLFNNEIGKNTPLITDLYCNYKITQMHKNRRFYCSDEEPFEKELYSRCNCDIGSLPTGGTVANTAFSLLINLGFEKIILIGQDLAYPDKKMHTEEAHAEKKIDESDGRYFYIEGIDGKPVLTEYNMYIYKKWYEEQISKYPDIEIIDATEGGALIEGTVIETLKVALSDNCGEKRKAFKEVIEAADPLFDEDNKSAKMKKIIEGTIYNIPVIMNELKRTLEVYDKLDELNRAGKYNTNTFKKCLNEITAFNNRMDNSLEILLMQLFSNKGDYEISDSLQERTDSRYEEMKLMIQIGKKLIETYVKAGNKLIRTWDEINNRDM